MSSPGANISVLISPAPGAWPIVARNQSADALAFRRELGLPTDAAIIMSGHQAGFWHAGIAAKWIAAQIAAERCHGAAVWLTVDQDVNDAAAVRVPVRVGESGGELAEVVWRVDGSAATINDRPTALVASFDAALLGETTKLAGATTAAGVSAIGEALRRCRTMPSAAAQLGAAATSLLAEWSGLPAGASVLATAISKTTAFAAIVQAMKSDLSRCVQTYNDAARAARVPGIGPLRGSELGPEKTELPLWWIDRKGGVRRPVTLKTLAEVPIAELAPKALLMTGLLRHLGCDLFIHGTGGGASEAEGGYDKVGERWLASWLGWTLAPSVVVSATMRLNLASGPVVTDDDVHRAAMLVQRARHSPAMLGDAAGEASKRALLAEITRRGASRAERAKAFRAMHALLDSVRSEKATELRAREADAAGLEAQRDRDKLAADRTWAFALHGRERIGELAGAVAAAFA